MSGSAGKSRPVSGGPPVGGAGTKPLLGRRVVVTRAKSGGDVLAERLRDLGAEALEFPVIKIVPPEDWTLVDLAVSRLEDYQWLVFTSQNGVDGFLGRLQGAPRPSLVGITVVAVGEATAARLTEQRIPLDLVPAEYSGKGVLAAMRPQVKKGDRVLMARGDLASPALAEGLRDLGAFVDDLVVYRNLPDLDRADELCRLFGAGGADAVTFTSSSTVTNLLAILGEGYPSLLAGIWIACIGPQTAETARKAGLKVHVMPDEATLPALADALADALGPKGD